MLCFKVILILRGELFSFDLNKLCDEGPGEEKDKESFKFPYCPNEVYYLQKLKWGNVLVAANVMQGGTIDLLLRGWVRVDGNANSRLFSRVT